MPRLASPAPRVRPGFARLLLAVAMAALAPIAAARAEEPSVMLLIDGSGSMWGPLANDRRAKVDIVREKLSGLLANQNQSPARVGLASYGHRRRGDCSDTEVIVAPGTDRDAVLAELQKLNPRGKGPVSKALLDAATAIGTTRPASMILITDGADNCQQDACATAKQIATTMPGLVIHALGVGLEPLAKPRVSCVAAETGGRYYDVDSPEALSASVDEAAALAMLVPGAGGATVAATPAPAAAPAPSTLRATLSLRDGGAAMNAPVRWRIFKAGDPKVLAESESAVLSAKLTPGSYEVEAGVDGLSARQTVLIEAGQGVAAQLALGAGRLSVTARAVAGAPPSPTAQITLTDTAAAGASWLATGAPAEFFLPPAKYTLVIADGAVRHTETIDVSAGTDKSVDVAFGTGRLELSAAMSESGSGIDNVLYSVSEDDPDSPDGRREVARSRAASPVFALPAGTYYVTARSGSAEVRERIAVGAGDVVKRVLMLPLASLSVSTTIAGQPVAAGQGLVYRISSISGETREVARSLHPQLNIQLLPGRYRIDASMSAHQLTASKDIVLEAGKAETVALALEAAEVTFKAPVEPAGERYWEVHDTRGLPVWRATGAEPKTMLPPGRYTVHLDVRDVSKEAAFEITSGEKKLIEIGQP